LTRLGLIGAGRWGQNYIRTIQSLPDLSLVDVVTRNWRPLVDRHRVDGIIIATPPSTHAEMVMAAIQAGLPCMVEKPLTTNLAEALAIQAIAQDPLVLVNHTQLFNPGYLALKRAAIQVISIEAEAGNYGPFRPDYSALWDYAPHDLSMCLDLLGTHPVKVELRHAELTGEGGSYELALEFPGGVQANIKISNIRQDKVRRFTVRCVAGTLVFDDLAQPKRPDEMPLRRAVQMFVDGICGGSRAMFGLDLGVEIVRILASVQDPA